MKTKITEESGVHKAWKDEANTVKSVEALAVFVDHLINDYEHDYGTIVHAISAAMIAAFHTVDESDQGGITGFQAGFIGWEMIHEFMGKMPLGGRLQNYNDLLYPQLEFKFKTISKKTFEKIVEEAKSKLANNNGAHPDVVSHWKFIAEGGIPFGFTIEKE